MRLFSSILVLLIYKASVVCAQVGMVKGLIRESQVGNPLPGVSVFIRGIPSATKTDSLGTFVLHNVPFGKVEIQMRKEGYQRLSVKANIQSLRNEINLEMPPQKKEVVSEQVRELNKYREKVALVTDKPYYYQGEVIWLKAYLNTINPSLRDSLSRVVYVDVMNSEGNIFKKLMLSADSGQFRGQIILPKEAPPGNYQIVAHTNFMRNFSGDYFYYQMIPILPLTYRVEEQSTKQETENANVISLNKQEYKLRERVALDFELEGGDYSISVTDATQVLSIPQNSFVNDWTFNETSIDETAKFNFITEKGVRFAGQFVNEFNTGKKARLTLYRKDRLDFTDVETNDDGIFQVNGLMFYDSAKFFVAANTINTKKSKKLFGSIKLIEQPYQLPKVVVPGKWFTVVDTKQTQSFLADYLLPSDSRLLDTLVIRSTKLNDDPNRLQGIAGGASTTLSGQVLENYPDNLVRGIAGRVPGLKVDCSQVPCSVWFNRASTSSFFNVSGPLVLVDNIPMGGQSAGEILGNINPFTVERIEFKPGLVSFYGSQAAGGIIAVYLKKGFQNDTAGKFSNVSVLLRGFSRPIDFVSPNYQNEEQEKTVADYRSTLYWQPSLSKGAGDRYSCSFFTSDLPGYFRIRVCGITKSHKPVEIVKYFQVKD